MTIRACVTAIVGFVVGFVQTAMAGAEFETQNGDTVVYTFGSPVESGETAHDNIDNSGRFAFRSGTVNVKEGGIVRIAGYDDGTSKNREPRAYANWVGANGYSATLNICGGTFWVYTNGVDASTYTGVGRLRIGVNNTAGGRTGVARLNLMSGVLRIDHVLMCGGSNYKDSSAKSTPAEMNMSGGTAIVNKFWLGASASGTYTTATFNLTGGEMQVDSFVFQPYHNQTFNWGAGTIIAGAENVFSEQALQGGCTRTVSVTGNPAVFNTGNFAQTIPAGISSGTGTLKLTGGNTVTLSAAPSFGLWLDGTALVVPADGLTIPVLTLSGGARLVFNADSLIAGQSVQVTAMGGISLPDGGNALDFVKPDRRKRR